MSQPSRCIVIGAGGHSRAVLALLYDSGWSRERVLACIDIHDTVPPTPAETVLDVPVVPANGAPPPFGFTAHAAFLAIGDSRLRREWAERSVSAGLDLPNLVSPTAYIGPEVMLGKGNVVGHGAFVGPGSVIGDYSIVNTGAIVEHECRIGSASHVAPGAIIAGRVSLGSRVFIGLGARLIDHLTVCDDVTVGAGATVVGDIEVPGTYIGTPAKRLA